MCRNIFRYITLVLGADLQIDLSSSSGFCSFSLFSFGFLLFFAIFFLFENVLVYIPLLLLFLFIFIYRFLRCCNWFIICTSFCLKTFKNEKKKRKKKSNFVYFKGTKLSQPITTDLKTSVQCT